MRVTVAICTWNRAKLLDQTLTQMRKLRIPEGVDWELLVVNNNSSDDTEEVICRHSAVLPLRGLFEEQPGKSHALNRAVREASGEYILWTDDDVLVDEEWLAAYHAAFQRWPDAAVFGGTIQPVFAGNPPRWFRRAWPLVASVYAAVSLGEEPRPITPPSLPYGANMAVHTERQRKFLYDPKLGPQPDSMIRGEETALVRAMLAQGVTGWWVPGARVLHYITEDRQTTDYLHRYFIGYGEEIALHSPDERIPKLFGQPRWLWRRLISAKFRYILRRMFCRPESWIYDLRDSAVARGMIRGYSRSRYATRLN